MIKQTLLGVNNRIITAMHSALDDVYAMFDKIWAEIRRLADAHNEDHAAVEQLHQLIHDLDQRQREMLANLIEIRDLPEEEDES